MNKGRLCNELENFDLLVVFYTPAGQYFSSMVEKDIFFPGNLKYLAAFVINSLHVFPGPLVAMAAVNDPVRIVDGVPRIDNKIGSIKNVFIFKALSILIFLQLVVG